MSNPVTPHYEVLLPVGIPGVYAQAYPITFASAIPEIVFLSNAAGRTPVANKGTFVPFIVQEAFIATSLALSISTTGTGNIDGGIYRLDRTLIVSSGSVALDGVAANPQIMDIVDTLLPRGYYFMALSTDASSGLWNASSITVLTQMSLGIQEMTTGAFPLPATATLVKPTITFLPVFSVQGRAI